MNQRAQTPSSTSQFVFMMQEWNEIQFNGVYYNPSKKGKPGELPAADTSYTFRYPRPDRYASNIQRTAVLWFRVTCNIVVSSNRSLDIHTFTMHPLMAWSRVESNQATGPACTHNHSSFLLWKFNINEKEQHIHLCVFQKEIFKVQSVVFWMLH